MSSKREGWSRRRLLKTVGAGIAESLRFQSGKGAVSIRPAISGDVTLSAPHFPWVNQVGGPRPQYVWENWEDLIYHDQDYAPAIMSAPEFTAFMEHNWTFNRAMEWHDEDLDGCIVSYSNAGDLMLTGTQQVSEWFSDPDNAISHSGEFTRFEKKSTRRCRDAIVLPLFQFHVGQHPRVELSVSEADPDWQFCISIKGRCGAPFICGGWQTGRGQFSFDIAQEWRQSGYTLNFAELHFVMGVWTHQAEASAAVTFRARLTAQPAVISSLPVVRTASSASHSGVPLVAVALNQQGERLKADRVSVFAEIEGQKIPLQEENGFWKTHLHGLIPGDYAVPLTAEGTIQASTLAQVRVTDGQFCSFDKTRRIVTRKGKPVGPLCGSYQGTFYFENAGREGEKLVSSQEEWDAWKDKLPAADRMHFWEALNDRELDERFAYLEQCGWDILALHQHWGLWERLDAGGHISPHAAEQLALYLRTAGRHGLTHIQALSSGSYAAQRKPKTYGQTPTWKSYVEAGFKNEYWYTPGERAFDKMFHQYLLEFTMLFREETALFGMSASGEGDSHNGLPRSNDVFHLVRSQDPNHVFLAEVLDEMLKVPQEYTAGWDQDMLGGRTYEVAEDAYPEFELGVEYKFWQMGKIYKAEGEWPAPSLYTHFHYETVKDERGAPESWVGTERYRTRLRDAIYLALVHRIPLIMSWDEQMTLDEHIVFRQVRELVDWSNSFISPKIAVRVDNSNVTGKGRAILVEYEKVFARLALSYRLILSDATLHPGVEMIIDGRRPYREPRFQSEGGTLPDAWKREIPLQVSQGYCASYTWSVDRRTLLAYVYNVTGHAERKQWLAGRFHRIPKPAELTMSVQNLPPGNLKCRLYDLNDKKLLHEALAEKAMNVDLGTTDRDYFVLVTPA
jgi:hypothetical protein